MNIRKPLIAQSTFIAICLGVLMLAPFHDARANYRIGQAMIKQRNAVPCFAIEPHEEHRSGAPRLFALTVLDISHSPAVKSWSFGFRSEGMLIPSNVSVCYGEIPSGAEGDLPKPLKMGVVYSVSLNARPEDTSDPTHGYDARFCLIGSTTEPKVVQISIDSQEWLDGVCPGAPRSK